MRGLMQGMARGKLMVWLMLAAIAMPVHAAPPRRIVSFNLCADQLLMALADRSQIAALTTLAGDRQLSAGAASAKNFPAARSTAESLLVLQPDLVIGPPGFLQRDALAALKGHAYRALELPSAESYPDILAQLRQVAKAIGHPERAEALIRRMDVDLSRIRPLPGAPVAAYYQRRGYLTGTDTLIDDLMKRLGLRNLAAALGKPMLAHLAIEEMVMAKPDYLIIETATGQIVDQGTEMLHHPALAKIPRLTLPQSWTVCGGPAYVQAAQSLTAQLHAVHRR